MKMLLPVLASLVVATAAVPASAQVYGSNGEAYCREYTNHVRVGGELRSSYGTACMQPDGAWQVVNENGRDLPRGSYKTVDYRVIESSPVVYRPAPVYERVVVVRPQPLISIGFPGYYNERIVYRGGNRHWDRNDRWDRHHGRGHGRWRD